MGKQRGVARGLGALLVLAVGVIAVLHGVVHVVHHHVRPLRYSVIRMVHMDMENSMPAWFSSSLLLGAALAGALCGLLAWQRHASGGLGPHPGAGHRAESLAWWVLAAGLGYLSLDEAITIHEHFGKLVGLEGGALPTFEWLVVGVVLAALGVATLLAVGRGFPRSFHPWLAGGVALYALGALGVEAINGYGLRATADGSTYQVVVGPALVVVEEVCEMVGVIIIGTGILSYLEGQGLFRARPLVDGRLLHGTHTQYSDEPR